MQLEQLKKLTDEQLNKRFPFMICRSVFGDKVCKDDDGKVLNHFANWGWRDIQLILAEHIKPIYDSFNDEQKKDFFITECKEKYGSLRIYWTTSNEAINLWTDLAEYISSFTCINCGKTVKQNFYNNENVSENPIVLYFYYESEGWINPYCVEHLDKDRKYNLSYRKGLFTFQRGIPYGPKQDITLNVEDFFKLEDDEQE